MTSREPLLWLSACNPLCIDSIELNVVRFVALSTCQVWEAENWQFNCSSLIKKKKKNQMRISDCWVTNPLVTTHDINYHFSFYWLTGHRALLVSFPCNGLVNWSMTPLNCSLLSQSHYLYGFKILWITSSC